MSREEAPPVNILTLRWGERYGPDYVNHLYHGIQANLRRPFRFFCFTDDGSKLVRGIESRPLPQLELPERYQQTAWLKLGLFRNDQDMTGDCLFLDLDVIITGPLDCFFDYMPGKRCIIHNWVLRHQLFKKTDVGNSSLFRWRANTMQFVVDKFYSERDWALSRFSLEQVYLTYALGEKYWWPAAWVRSFKRHAVPDFPLNLFLPPKLPKDTRILVFHGRPDPDQALHGCRTGKLHRWSRPAPWIAEHWYGAALQKQGP